MYFLAFLGEMPPIPIKCGESPANFNPFSPTGFDFLLPPSPQAKSNTENSVSSRKGAVADFRINVKIKKKEFLFCPAFEAVHFPKLIVKYTLLSPHERRMCGIIGYRSSQGPVR
jgi:hypothetical protein